MSEKNVETLQSIVDTLSQKSILHGAKVRFQKFCVLYGNTYKKVYSVHAQNRKALILGSGTFESVKAVLQKHVEKDLDGKHPAASERIVIEPESEQPEHVAAVEHADQGSEEVSSNEQSEPELDSVLPETQPVKDTGIVAPDTKRKRGRKAKS